MARINAGLRGMEDSATVELVAGSVDPQTGNRTEAEIVIRLKVYGSALKQFALKPENPNDPDCRTFVVPKTHLFGHASTKLADGATVQANWTLPATRAEQEALFNAGIEAGFKVIPLGDTKVKKAKRASLDLASLKAMQAAK